MSSGLKLTSLCTVPLLLAFACQPDLDSLQANYSASSGSPGVAGFSASAGSSARGGMDNSGGGAPVPPNSCENQARDSNESDVDCGGTSKCGACATNSRCTANKDCLSAFCKTNRCAEPTCTDKVKNQDETGTDCGGSCAPCDVGVACGVNEDCAGEYCLESVCADHCTSGTREADETDKDCGGATCPACDDKLHCQASSDCRSLLCINNACKPASCTDQIKNQDESDTDCGGACSGTKPCPVTAHCNVAGDCESWICTKNKCAADIVVDPANVIDDFEDGDFMVRDMGGRVGNWYTFHDSTADGVVTMDISPSQRNSGNVRAMHTSGMGFTIWGSGIGGDFHNVKGTKDDKARYDASSYTGITFWARAKTAVTVTVTLPDEDTEPAIGLCTTCDHHYYKSLQVDTTWQRFTVRFADLTLEPGDDPVPTAFKPAGLVSVQFRMVAGSTYELWIDDVAFVK